MLRSRSSKLMWVMATGSLLMIVRVLTAQEGQPSAAVAGPSEVTAPQVVARVSDRFVNHFVARSISQWQVITEMMFGTSTSGLASMQGHVTAELVPDGDQAALDIRLIGTSRCDDNVGQRRSVTIRSTAGAEIDARKRVLISPEGISSLPAVAACSAYVEIQEIAARRRVVERIAWRRADRMHGQIQEAAATSAQTRTQQQLDQELTDALTEADKVIQKEIRDSQLGRAEFPCRVVFSSSLKHLQIGLISRDKSQHGDPTTALQLDARHDVALGLHQNCLNHILQFSLGGKEIKDAQFLDLMQFITGNSPRSLWVHDRTERWSVTPDRQSPFRVEFQNDRLMIWGLFTQVQRGQQTFERPIELHCSYRAEITPDGPHFVRDGDLLVSFPDGQTTRSEDESLRSFLAQKFKGVFPSDLYFDGLVAPAGGALSKLRDLELKELSFREGRGVIGYQLRPTGTQIAQNVKASGS